MVRSGLALLFLLGSAAIVACSSSEDVTATGDDAISAAPAARWQLPREVLNVGARVRVSYDGAPRWSTRACAGRLRTGSAELGGFLRDQFDAVDSIGGYACRPNTADTKMMSVHGTGRALDIFIPKVGGRADNAKGDAVANWLVANATQVGIQLVIWDRTVWRSNGTNDKVYGGPHPHDDHIHVELTVEAAAKQTAWFTSGHASIDAGPTTQDAGSAPQRDAGSTTTTKDAGSTPKDAGKPTPEDPPPPPEEEEPEDEGTPTEQPPPKKDADAGSSSSSPSDNDFPDEGEEQELPSDPDQAPQDDGPGERDSLGTSSRKKSNADDANVIPSSGCAIDPHRPLPSSTLGGVAVVAIAAAFVRRRKATKGRRSE